MPKQLFSASSFDTVNKTVEIRGPDDFRMEVDYDDVDHPEVRRTAKRIILLLNKHWETKDELCNK